MRVRPAEVPRRLTLLLTGRRQRIHCITFHNRETTTISPRRRFAAGARDLSSRLRGQLSSATASDTRIIWGDWRRTCLFIPSVRPQLVDAATAAIMGSDWSRSVGPGDTPLLSAQTRPSTPRFRNRPRARVRPRKKSDIDLTRSARQMSDGRPRQQEAAWLDRGWTYHLGRCDEVGRGTLSLVVTDVGFSRFFADSSPMSRAPDVGALPWRLSHQMSAAVSSFCHFL